ncbi:MAG: copper resistance protein CopC [Ardenticatenaceae bacterium]|nr:copper resistance protein CopC [Ardenticatenaceae bacterium]
MHRRFAIKHIYQIGLALAVTLVAGLVLVHQASAHAFLLRSDPPANAILPESPPAMRLWFNEVISPGFSQARLLDAEGHSLPVTVEADPDDATLLIVNFPELEDGVYSVRWNVLSAADGHPTQGLVVFGVGEGADLGTATAVVQDTAVPWPDPILRWLNFVLLAGLVGCFAVAFLVLDPAVYPPDIAAVQHAAQRRILRLAWWCGVAALLLGVVWAGWQAILLSNTLASGASVSSIAPGSGSAERPGVFVVAAPGFIGADSRLPVAAAAQSGGHGRAAIPCAPFPDDPVAVGFAAGTVPDQSRSSVGATNGRIAQ